MGRPGRKKRIRDQNRRAPRKLNRREEYAKYLKSPEWQEIRQIVLERDSYRCLCCGDPANEVHHRSYSPRVMAGRGNNKLASICRRCHSRIHYSNDGEPLGKKDTEKAFKAMVIARADRLLRASAQGRSNRSQECESEHRKV